MPLFKEMLSSNESLFINEIALDVDYIPPIIKYRENQQQYIATCIKPLLQNRNGKNIFITGTPGIGKTVAIRHILNELNKETDSIETVYVNCWKKDTSFKVINDICEQIGYKWVHNKSGDQILADITKILNKKPLVLVLDEFDKLTEPELIYILVEDIYKKTLILITNEESLLSEIDQRISSRLMAESLKFNPYNKEETKGILRQRVEYAFPPNIVDLDAFNSIVEKAFELKDIRSGLFLLKEAASLAENESSKKIQKKHSDKAIEKLKDFKIKKSTDLNEDEQVILDLIKHNSGKTTTELYRVYKRTGDKSYRTFYRKIKDLDNAKLVTIKEINKGNFGNTSIVEYGKAKDLTDY